MQVAACDVLTEVEHHLSLGGADELGGKLLVFGERHVVGRARTTLQEKALAWP